MLKPFGQLGTCLDDWAFLSYLSVDLELWLSLSNGGSIKTATVKSRATLLVANVCYPSVDWGGNVLSSMSSGSITRLPFKICCVALIDGCKESTQPVLARCVSVSIY